MLGMAWAQIRAVFGSALGWLESVNAKMEGYGAAIIQGLVRGILSAPGAVWNALKGVVLQGITNIRAFLGIKSPSRLFMGIGGYMTEGLALGLDKGARKPLQSMARLSAGVAGAMALSAAPVGAADLTTATRSAQGVAQDVAKSVAPAPARAPQRLGGAAAMPKIELHIHQQPGEDAEALARRVMQLLERKIKSEARGTYRDE